MAIRRSARALAQQVVGQIQASSKRDVEGISPARQLKRKRASPQVQEIDIKPQIDDSSQQEVSEQAQSPVKQKKRKKAKKVTQPIEYPPRWPLNASRKAVGSHVSISGGCENAPHNALLVGGRAFALFLKNQRQWASKPMTDETIEKFPLFCSGKSKVEGDNEDTVLGDGEGFDRLSHILPHGCYLVNLANPDPDKWQKSYETFLDEVKRAEVLGIRHFNFHPGSSTGACTREEAIASIAKGINQAHKETSTVCILLENMAGKGNIIGGKFEDLADVIALVEDKTRVGICLDTCHTLAAGYDIRTPETYHSVMDEFDRIVGLSYIKAFHCNDSKGELGSHKDRHENIGMGHLGLLGFACLLGDARFDGLPFILETPMLDGTLNAAGIGGAIWQKEIRLLYQLEALAQQTKPNELSQAIEDDASIQSLFQEIKAAVEAQRLLDATKKADKKAAADSSKSPKSKSKKAALKQGNETNAVPHAQESSDSELSDLE